MAVATEYPVRLPSDVGKLGEETPMFTKAYSESFKTGSFLPMLKQELRLKIQNRRLSEGQPELQVKFEEAEKHPLTENEKKKMECRKHHNRISAKKCRDKKKAEETSRIKELRGLETRNKHLWDQYHKKTQWRILLIKKILNQIRKKDPSITEADFLTILPDLLKVRQAEKALFLKNNVQAVSSELTDNGMLNRSSEIQEENSCIQNVSQQHNNVLDWLQQCSEVQGEVEIQAEPDEIQAEPDEIQPVVDVYTQQNTFHYVYENPQSDFTLQQITDLQPSLQTNVGLQLEEDTQVFVQEHGCDDTSDLNNSFSYQQTNAVLEGLDFLLSGNT